MTLFKDYRTFSFNFCRTGLLPLKFPWYYLFVSPNMSFPLILVSASFLREKLWTMGNSVRFDRLGNNTKTFKLSNKPLSIHSENFVTFFAVLSSPVCQFWRAFENVFHDIIYTLKGFRILANSVGKAFLTKIWITLRWWMQTTLYGLFKIHNGVFIIYLL